MVHGWAKVPRVWRLLKLAICQLSTWSFQSFLLIEITFTKTSRLSLPDFENFTAMSTPTAHHIELLNPTTLFESAPTFSHVATFKSPVRMVYCAGQVGADVNGVAARGARSPSKTCVPKRRRMPEGSRRIAAGCRQDHILRRWLE